MRVRKAGAAGGLEQSEGGKLLRAPPLSPSPPPPLPPSRDSPGIGNTCTDSGQIDGRPYSQITGCVLYGRLSRVAYDPLTARVTLPVQVVMDGEANGRQGCSQFSTHGITGLVLGPGDGYIYFSYGEGASFQAPDNGEFGSNPCGDAPGYTGAYRAQNPAKLHGKVNRLDPVSLAITPVTMGHRNPYRLTVWQGQLYESETGWFSYVRGRRAARWPHRFFQPTIARTP